MALLIDYRFHYPNVNVPLEQPTCLFVPEEMWTYNYVLFFSFLFQILKSTSTQCTEAAKQEIRTPHLNNLKPNANLYLSTEVAPNTRHRLCRI
jgi:hypothetical protein